MAIVLQELRELGRSLEDSVFVCGGTAPIPQSGRASSPQIVLHYEASDAIHAIRFPGCTDNELNQLLAACKPVAAGRGRKKTAVGHMDASSFTTSLHLAELSTLTEAQSILAPNAEEIRAILIKLDVLGKGGVLKAQPVKPKDKSAFGTLVVSLPTIFQGGDLLVKSDSGAARRFDTCKYEALPVTAGYRATLTYVLKNPNGAANMCPSPPGGVQSSYSLEEKLHEAFKNPEFAPNGAKLGFALTHNGVVENDNAIPVLKGSDRMLKTCLDRLGLKYEFIPVYQSYDYDASRLVKQQDDDVRPEAQDNDSRKRNRDDYEYDNLSEWRFGEEDAKARGIWSGDGALHLFASEWGCIGTTIDDAPDGEETIEDLDIESLRLSATREILWITPPRYPFPTKLWALPPEPTVTATQPSLTRRAHASLCGFLHISSMRRGRTGWYC